MMGDNGVKRVAQCLCALATAALTAAITVQVSAADQPKPILRIETARHNSRMNDAATDRAGHLLLTVGDDKTARMWSLPDLRPIGVLRPAIGPKAEGALYAVAISPDGAVAAVGGAAGDFCTNQASYTNQAFGFGSGVGSGL